MGRSPLGSLRFWLVLGLAPTATHAPTMSTHLGRPTRVGAAWGHCLGVVMGRLFTPTLREVIHPPPVHSTAVFPPCTPAYRCLEGRAPPELGEQGASSHDPSAVIEVGAGLSHHVPLTGLGQAEGLVQVSVLVGGKGPRCGAPGPQGHCSWASMAGLAGSVLPGHVAHGHRAAWSLGHRGDAGLGFESCSHSALCHCG